MSDIAQYQFNIAKDGKSLSIEPSEKDKEAFTGLLSLPRAFLHGDVTPEQSFIILRATLNCWYAVHTGTQPDRIFVGVEEYDAECYPKTVTLTVK